MEIKKVILFIFLCFLCGCSYQKRIASAINKEQNIRFYNSRKENAMYIKKNRENVIKYLLEEKKIVGKYYIIEKYYQLFTPKMATACIIDNSKTNYYSNVNGILIKDEKTFDYEKNFYKKVYSMSIKGEYDSLKKMHEIDNRRSSSPGNCYLTIIEFYDNKKFKIEKVIQFQSFGVIEEDLKDFKNLNW